MIEEEETETERQTKREGQDGCLICFEGLSVLMFFVFFWFLMTCSIKIGCCKMRDFQLILIKCILHNNI
jgi:hypothetical protein